MKLISAACAILAASAAMAEEFTLSSRITDVTVYPQVAELTRKAEVQIPAGRHQLIVQDIPNRAVLDTLQVEVSGAALIATRYRTEDVPPRDSSSPAIRAAESKIAEIEIRIQTVRDAAERVRQQERAAQNAIGFLRDLGDNDGLAQIGTDGLRDIVRMIEEETARAGTVALEAEIEARGIEVALEDLEEELRAARQALAAIRLEDEDRLYLVLDVAAEAAGAVSVDLSYVSEAGWQPGYEVHLVTGTAPRLTLKRSVMLYQDTGEAWKDVALTLSSLTPSERGSPSQIYPQQLRIMEPAPVPQMKSSSEAAMDSLAEPVSVEPVVVEQFRAPWDADVDGPGVTYHFDHPVSVAPGGEGLRLQMDQLTTQAELFAMAVPLRDDTAYRVARFSNTFGEDLLRADTALYFVDDKLVTAAPFSALAAGEESEVGFGPIRGLQITRNVLSRREGERGMISRSNQQMQRVEIEVQNLTGQSWPLRLVDRVPYSEQDDLVVSWKSSPAVSEENVEKQRGILAWEFEVGAGEERNVSLETTFEWPEGMVLR